MPISADAVQTQIETLTRKRESMEIQIHAIDGAILALQNLLSTPVEIIGKPGIQTGKPPAVLSRKG